MARRTTGVVAGPHTSTRSSGRRHTPLWWLNLHAHPEATAEIGAKPVMAREAGAQKCARLWHQLVATYSGYAAHEKRTTRAIPVVILESQAE